MDHYKLSHKLALLVCKAAFLLDFNTGPPPSRSLWADRIPRNIRAPQPLKGKETGSTRKDVSNGDRSVWIKESEAVR